jgi:hypothetical protein
MAFSGFKSCCTIEAKKSFLTPPASTPGSPMKLIWKLAREISNGL